MVNNRRNFLKFSGLAGLMGMTGTGMLKSCLQPGDGDAAKKKSSHLNLPSIGEQHFNMCGYAAPKLDTVRVGLIGLGNRGILHLGHMLKIKEAQVVAICDIRPEKISAAQASAEKMGQQPATYSGGEHEWKKLCEREDLDLIFICTPWAMHTPMAVYAMEQGKHVCVEVPASVTVEESWQLVETSERARKYCMMLENVCYGFFELLTLNMARQGLFGDIIHGEAAYIHDLLVANFDKTEYYDMWRLRENAERNGNLYPTHGLGPICQVMNINRGDKMDFLVSVSSHDFMMGAKAKELAAKDAFYKPFVDKPFRGNINTSVIKTTLGRTIMLQHDVTSPRPYSRIDLISGTKGAAMQYPKPAIYLADEHPVADWRKQPPHDWVSPEQYKELEKKYSPEIVKKLGDLAARIGGHGGKDFLMNWRTIDCLRNGLPLDQDVYDAALWSAVGNLTEQSVSQGSNAVAVPDFTRGSWNKNRPVDISLSRGGTTGVAV